MATMLTKLGNAARARKAARQKQAGVTAPSCYSHRIAASASNVDTMQESPYTRRAAKGVTAMALRDESVK
jgi:hypothetical protein